MPTNPSIRPLSHGQLPVNPALGKTAPVISSPSLPPPSSNAVAPAVSVPDKPLQGNDNRHPMDWDLGKIIPPLGILSNVLWGISNVAEHHLQGGARPHNKALMSLAMAAPVINVGYGALNTVGALAQGYSIRTFSFASFTLLSLLFARTMRKDNKYTKIILEEGKKLSAHQLGALIQKGRQARAWTSLYNAVAPIGLLTGLFSITKVAQSTPSVKLEHPEGNTFRKMQWDALPGKKFSDVFLRNLQTEWHVFKSTLLNSLHHSRSTFKDITQAIRNLYAPSQNQQNEHPITRFLKPITDGHSVPLFYSQATVGRVLYSILASVLFMTGSRALMVKQGVYGKDFLVRKSLYHKIAHCNLDKGVTRNNYLGKALNMSILWGNLAGTAASMFTKFNDWPVLLSSVYRTSGIAYGSSAFCALLSACNIKSLGPVYQKGKLLGLDERIWTKIGAFIQGTSYFVNLLLKAQKSDRQA